MKKRMSFRLQWQYFASYLALMLIVMMVFLTYAYNSFAGFHRQMALDNYRNRLGLLRSEQEGALTDMVAIAGQIMEVTSKVPFAYREKPELATDLRNQLSAYRATHDTLEEIYIHFFDDEFVHTSTGSYLVDRFINQMMLLSDVSRETLEEYLNDARQLTMLPMQTIEGYAFQNTMGLRQMTPVFVPVSISGGLRCGVAMFLIEDRTYDTWFASVVSPEADVYILKEDTLLASQQISGVPTETVLAACAAGQDTLTWEGGGYHLLQLPGKTFGYRYLALISDSELSMGLSASVKMLMLLAAVVSALGVLVIHYLVQRNTRPIKLLHSMISDREPTGNELIEIRDGIQRLIEENAAMSSRMEDMETLRKSDFVRRFLVGAFKSEDEYLTFAETIALNVDTACYAVAIIAKPSDAEYELTAEKINRLFEGEVCGVARALGLQDRLAVVAFAGDKQTLTDFLESKLAGLRACCSGVTMAVSGVHSDYREGQRAYLEAENAFELRFIKGNARALMFGEVAGPGTGRMQYNPQLMERLRKALHVGDAAQVSAALREITRAMRGMDASLFDFRCMYNDILNVVSSEAREQGVQEEAVYDLFKLSQCLSLDDLDAMLHHVCAGLVSDGSGRKLPQASEPVARAYEIILRRFSEPGLSVSAIAEEVGMSDSRLSTEFKKVYRMTPLEHITRARMQRARRLLRTTDMPVKDIAVECGYYDISGFNRRFKAYTGMTPQQYKQSSDAGGETANDEIPQPMQEQEHSS
ncbi:MAG: helix-turn-helix transcriptional regulator [Aristaeellaceae bacterium]